MGTAVRRLLELIRFSHTIFALPFALMSAALAWQDAPFHAIDLVGILLSMVMARSAAMAFNRLVDRDIDARNPRTASRHLPAGLITPTTVILFTLVCCLGFLGATLLFQLREPPNPWPFRLAVPVLVILLGYSLAKRFTSLAHVWLGLALMLAPIAAWIAIRGLEDLAAPVILGVAVLFWVSGFDILYACQDADFDRQAGLHSIPARFGIRNSLRIAAGLHALMLVALAALPLVSDHFGLIYVAGLIAVTGLLIYEHWIVSPDDLSRVNRAFFQVNGVISMGLLILTLIQFAVR